MRSLPKLLIIVVCFAILIAPTLNSALGLWKEEPLAGAHLDAKRPPFAARGLFDESFQKGFTAWFDDSYGARGTAVRLDNSLGYWLLGELRPEKMVKVGKRGVLFHQDQVWFHNATRSFDAKTEAEHIKAAQDAMLAHGKVFVVVVMPGKNIPSMFRAEIPVLYDAPMPEPRPAEVLVHKPFIDELRKAGAFVIDGRDVVADLPREMVYPTTGRHMTSLAACRVLEAAFAIARPRLPSYEIPPLDCSYTLGHGDPMIDEGWDLWRLLNSWTPLPQNIVPLMAKRDEVVPKSRRPPTLFVGSSFSFKLIGEARRNHALGQIRFYSYNKLEMDFDRENTPEFVHDVQYDTPRWKTETLENALYIMEMPEEYIGPNCYSGFSDQMTRAFGK